MENNFFEYLIIIFFIVTALQSLLGKKKKKGQPKPPTSSPKPEQRTTQKVESAQDIFEELFGLKTPQRDQGGKQTKIPSDTGTEVLDRAEKNETTWNPEEEYEDSLGIETVRYEDKKETKRSYHEEMARLDEHAKRAKRSLEKLPDKIEVEDIGGVSKEVKKLAAKIKGTIRNPETLREYILVSEILNKPKAFRR